MTSSGLPDGSITVKDLFIELKNLHDDLTRVLTHMERVDTRNENADQLHADHEGRLRALEKFRFTLLGVSTAGAALAGTLGAWLQYLFSHH